MCHLMRDKRRLNQFLPKALLDVPYLKLIPLIDNTVNLLRNRSYNPAHDSMVQAVICAQSAAVTDPGFSTSTGKPDSTC